MLYQNRVIINDIRIPKNYSVNYVENKGYNYLDPWFEVKKSGKIIQNFPGDMVSTHGKKNSQEVAIQYAIVHSVI